MSCLEFPREAVPDFSGKAKRDFNDAETMKPRTPAQVPQDLKNGGRVKAATNFNLSRLGVGL